MRARRDESRAQTPVRSIRERREETHFGHGAFDSVENVLAVAGATRLEQFGPSSSIDDPA